MIVRATDTASLNKHIITSMIYTTKETMRMQLITMRNILSMVAQEGLGRVVIQATYSIEATGDIPELKKSAPSHLHL